MPNVKIDGRAIAVAQGTTVLQAAEMLGLEVPQMCYHPGLRVVGVCRVCLCQVKGQPKMTTACSTEVRDGMEVGLYTPEAEKARRSVIEFWLLNHPLDCPVCDQGGECPLQDIAFDHGPGVSRLNDPKVKKNKRVDLGPHVVLDEERCILCWRCTRFTQEVSGSNQIMLSDRGVYTTVGTPPGITFDDPYSGNVVDLCPVGALTSHDFRFRSRIWEMASTEGVCTACAVGCNTYVWSKKGAVERLTARPNVAVNDYWLCDRGRFDVDFVNDPRRLTRPRLRRDGQLVEVEWDDALEALVSGLQAVGDSEPNRAAVIASPHLSNEEYWTLQRFLRSGLGSNHLNVAGLDPVTPARTGLAESNRMAGSIREIDDAEVILIVGGDLEQTHPVYALRVRKAVAAGARLVVASPSAGRLDSLAASVERVASPDAAGWVQDLTGALGGGSGSGAARVLGSARRVVILANADRANDGVAAVLGSLLDAAPAESLWRVLLLDEGGNRAGSGLLGMSSTHFPGPQPITADSAQEWKTRWGGRVHGQPGGSWDEIVQGAGAGSIGALLLVNSGRPAVWGFSGPELALLEKAPFVVAWDLFGHEVESFAHVVLPAPSFAESDATFTTPDGVVQLARRNIVPRTLTPVQVLARVAARMQIPLSGPEPVEVFREIAQEVPGLHGLTYGDVSGPGSRSEAAPALAGATQ